MPCSDRTCLDNPVPPGLNVPGNNGVVTSPSPPKPMVWQVLSGNSNSLTTKVTLGDGTTAVTPENSRLTFSLAETQFCPTPLWQAEWRNGIVETAPGSGVIKITIPSQIMSCLRRGSYMFSLLVADAMGDNAYTALRGTMLVEYDVGGPQHDIPYRHDTWPY